MRSPPGTDHNSTLDWTLTHPNLLRGATYWVLPTLPCRAPAAACALLG